MEKCIYFGLAKDFWWRTRFKNFIESLDALPLVDNEFSLMQEALRIPLVYYSHEHNVTIHYKREEQYETDSKGSLINGTAIIRARVTLYGELEHINALEGLIKKEAEKLKGIDTINS